MDTLNVHKAKIIKMEANVSDIKRHNSFTSPNTRRAPISKRVGRERCHSYHAQDNFKKPDLPIPPSKVSIYL
ncbi:unnamed protein product [Euphydryas editha]|uniref:Uncharacterized protein n=1 Tax=Euphydryas editha TaxID=104508 RepID=A0AAU9U2F9_EUPED|nr:unnamed protein product [Euphydryas editha]